MRNAAVVFFCHGSRDAQWRRPFEQIVHEYRDAHPGCTVDLAFLEMMAPTLPEAIEQCMNEGVDSIRIVPLFLAPGAHTERDLPRLVGAAKRRWPSLTVSIAPTLMASDAVRRAIVADNPT